MEQETKQISDPKEPGKIKLMATGERSVGKTCVYLRHNTGVFPTEFVPAVFDIYAPQIEKEGNRLDVELCDSYGGEEHYKMRNVTYPGVDVIMLCFAIDFRGSLDKVRSYWRNELKKRAPGVPIVLVGCKADLREGKDQKEEDELIPEEDGEKMALDIGAAKYMECSAKTGQGIDVLFQLLHDLAFEHSKTKGEAKKESKDCTIL